MSIRLISGDCREVLRSLPDRSVQMCVTSPPYFGLRDYGTGTWSGGDPECAHSVGGQVQDNKAPGAITSGVRPGVDAWTCRHCGATRTDSQIGLEPSPDAFVAEMVAVFREVRRVLRDDGVLFLNLGDSYATSGGHTSVGVTTAREGRANLDAQNMVKGYRPTSGPIKPKDLIGIPWMVAFALRADGWWLRSDIIWAKPNPMPESVTDRPTAAHEHVFLLTKSSRYFWDAAAVRGPASEALIKQVNEGYNGHDTKDYGASGAQSASGTKSRIIENARAKIDKQRGHSQRHDGFNDRWDAMSKAEQQAIGANIRNVWTIATAPYPEAHFATFPPELAERCIKAGTSERGCCADCGAPWERMIERLDQGYDGSRYGERAVAASGGAKAGGTAQSTLGSSNGKLTGVVSTTGWQSTCSCDAAVVPCTVLDPFAGAFTSMLVADRLQRTASGLN